METFKPFDAAFSYLKFGLKKMKITKIENNIYLLDVETAGIKNFIASYIVKSKKTAIIETGPTSSVHNLLSGLKELNIKPEEIAYVAVSHIHLDHGGGVGTLLNFLPEAKVIVHQRGAPHLVNPEKLWQQSLEVLGSIAEMYGKPEPVSEERIIVPKDGSTFDLGNSVELKVVETLGHASHHLSYYTPFTNGIFPGDAAGIYLNEIGVIVPTTPPPFRLDIALASLDKLIKWKPKVLYYSHFGKAHNAVEKLQTYVRQIKLWAKIAEQEIQSGKDMKAIRQKIVENDEATRKALQHIQRHLVLSETTLNESVRGFVDFVEKFPDFQL